MKYIKIISLLCLALLASSSACSPEPDIDIDSRSQIIGTWYTSTSNIAGSHWYELNFYSDGTGKYENEGPYSVLTATFRWEMNGNKVTCTGYQVTIDSDNDVDSGVWNQSFTYNSIDKKLFRDGLSNFWYKKLGEDYPEDSGSNDDYDDNDNDEDNNDEDKEPEPKPEFIPYLRVEEKLPQRSDGNKYCVLFDVLYGGSNIPSSGINRLGYVIIVESGYFDYGSANTNEKFRDVEVIDDKTYYWTDGLCLYGNKSNPIKITIKEKWAYSSHPTVYLGESYSYTFPYDPSKEDGVGSESSIPIQPGTSGTLNGHEWVDLGLSVKWATMNIGANAEYEIGQLFQWSFNEVIYDRDKSDGCELNTQYSAEDAVKALWGDGWRLPTREEMQELINLCDAKWDYAFNKPLGNIDKYWPTINGIEGAKVWGDTGQSIFLPVCKTSGCYWTHTLSYDNGSIYPCIGCFESNVFGWRISMSPKDYFNLIRAVCE